MIVSLLAGIFFKIVDEIEFRVIELHILPVDENEEKTRIFLKVSFV